MKLRVLDYLVCPLCRGGLLLREPVIDTIDRPAGDHMPACSGLCGAGAQATGRSACAACARLEVVFGRLDCACAGCGGAFRIAEGVPRLAGSAIVERDAAKAQTATSFGFLWAQARLDPEAIPSSYHFEKLVRTLSLEPLRGAVLDAGCGEGIDLVNQSRHPGVEVIGAELSDGGCRTTAARILAAPNAHVVQADLGHLPFRSACFDFIYSYGVLHHMAEPAEGAAELARVARRGGSVMIYVYEDFGDRSAGWRWLLRASNSLRHLTTRLPSRLLYALCQAGSPIVYLTFTVPHLVFRRVPRLRGLAASMPFRHGKGPFRLTGDLYDRFSAPVEYRYSRDGAAALLASVGLTVVRVGNERGWMVLGAAP